MQKYRVMIHGQNLLMELNGVRQRAGFFTNVFVEAFTTADAGERAIEILRDDAHLRGIALNTENDALRFTTDEVHEIESFDGERVPRQGLVFYEEKPNDSV